MPRPTLKTDTNGRPVQSLQPSMTDVASTTISGTTSRIALPTGCSVVRLAATGHCYFKFGDSSVEATSSDCLFPAGVELFSVDPTWTHVAVIQNGAETGTFSINEMT